MFGEGNLISNQNAARRPAASQDGMIVLLTITVDSRGARVSFIHYLPIWAAIPTTWSCRGTAGAPTGPTPPPCAPRMSAPSRSPARPRIQPIPAHLP